MRAKYLISRTVIGTTLFLLLAATAAWAVTVNTGSGDDQIEVSSDTRVHVTVDGKEVDTAGATTTTIRSGAGEDSLKFVGAPGNLPSGTRVSAELGTGNDVLGWLVGSDGGAGDLTHTSTIRMGFGDDLAKPTPYALNAHVAIHAGRGNDRINATRLGNSKVFGDRGRDRINVRDDDKDIVNCGKGRDRVAADSEDVVSANCEKVEVAAP